MRNRFSSLEVQQLRHFLAWMAGYIPQPVQLTGIRLQRQACRAAVTRVNGQRRSGVQRGLLKSGSRADGRCRGT